MRDYALVAAIAAALGIAVLYPFAGVILWTWFSVQNPHEEAWSFVHSMPLNLIIAIVTVLAWMASRERKFPPSHFLVWLILIFLAWSTFNGFFAYSPDWSWPYWDRTWKTLALGLLIATLATNVVRIHAIVWTIVLSLFYFGVKGGVFTLVTGGHFHVIGPPNTIIGDNNQLALALLMALPLANYLRHQSANKYVAWGLSAGIILTLIAVVGSYSRGALVALGALAIAWLMRSRRKFAYLLCACIASAAIFNFMPSSFWHRADTIETAETDASFQGRVIAWQVAYRYASDHFPFGAGFYGPQLPEVFHKYFPNEKIHAAHSIFFQVLGENGFVGLALYLIILTFAFMKCSAIMRQSRNRPALQWCFELARMIQLSLLAFCVGGAALSMAYYDVFIVCVALLIPMSELATAASEPHRLSAAIATIPGLPTS